MDEQVERELSHYLWSLNNALCGLISLCKDKPEISERIIQGVEDKLTEWNEHKAKHLERADNINPANDEDTKEETRASSPIIAWGDCSDEEDENENFSFPEATGLCKPKANKEDKKDIDDALDIPLFIDDVKEHKIVQNKLEIEHVLNGPLFIDDTQQQLTNNDKVTKSENVSKPKQLTWAQRTKTKKNAKNCNNDKYEISSNHSSKDSVHSIKSSISSKSNCNTKKTKKSPPKTTKSKVCKTEKSEVQNDGWSKVYYSKKTKIQNRNRSKNNISKSQQQRLHEAEEKKKMQLLEQKKKHKKIFENINEKISKMQQNQNSKIEQKKRAQRERLQKAEEKRKKKDDLRKEKVIKDDVRREEIRIYQEWNQQKKKSHIVEKQVAAEIRKLKMKTKITQKVSNKEEKVKDIQQRQHSQIEQQKLLQSKKLFEAAKRKEIEQKKKAKERRNSLTNILKKEKRRKQNNSSNNKKKKTHTNNKKEERNMKIDDKMLGDSESVSDIERYYKSSVIDKGSIKYMAIPKLNNVSTIAKDQIHHFYAKTSKFIGGKSVNFKLLDDAMRELLKKTVEVNFEDMYYRNDVLLVINRLIQFDLSSMPFKCSKSMINLFVLYSVNSDGTLLLTIKYLKQLLLFYNECVYQYFYQKNDSFKPVLPQISILLSRVISKINSNQSKYDNDAIYQQFKSHCIYFALLQVYNASILIKIFNFFKCINVNKEYLDNNIYDTFLSILLPISDLLKQITFADDMMSRSNDAFALNVSKLIEEQLDLTKCGGILNFMSKLVFYDLKNDKKKENEIDKYSSDSIILLNGSIAFLNCVCKINVQMVETHILEFEMEIYHIFIRLLEYTSANFMVETKRTDNEHIANIRELCKGLLELITFSAFNNHKVQEMFRFISCDKPTLLKQLCQFPFFFFLNNEGKLSLFPTLIAITFNNEENLNVLAQTLDRKHIKVWLKKNIFEYIKQKKKKKDKEMDLSLKIFEQKIPRKHWPRCLELY